MFVPLLKKLMVISKLVNLLENNLSGRKDGVEHREIEITKDVTARVIWAEVIIDGFETSVVLS